MENASKKNACSRVLRKICKYSRYENSHKIIKTLQKNFDLVILEGAGSPAEINLQKYDIANMKIAKKANAHVLLVTDIDKGGSLQV